MVKTIQIYHAMVLEVRCPKIKVMEGLCSFWRLRGRVCPYLFHLLEATVFLDSHLLPAPAALHLQIHLTPTHVSALIIITPSLILTSLSLQGFLDPPDHADPSPHLKILKLVTPANFGKLTCSHGLGIRTRTFL